MQYSVGFSPTNVGVPLMKNIVAYKPERNHSELTSSEESARGRPLGILYLDNKISFEAASHKKTFYERITTIYSKG